MDDRKERVTNMTIEQKIAIDIYTYMYRVFFGDSKEEIDYRVRFGSHGAATKVLNYIMKRYIKEEK